MRYGRSFKIQLFTVLFIIGLGFIFSVLSRSPTASDRVELPPYTEGQVKLLQRYIQCKPYIGYNRLYLVWREEAKSALDMGIAVAPVYRARNLARSLAPILHTSPDDKELLNLAVIMVLREDLIEWYASHMDKQSFLNFQKTHVGYLKWHSESGCIDYSFIPIYALPYRLKDIDILSTWKQAEKMGIDVSGYVDGVYMEKLWYNR